MTNMKSSGLIIKKCLSKDTGRAINFIEITSRPDFIKAIDELRKKRKIDIDFLLSGTSESENELMYFLENTDSLIAKDIEDLLINLKISPSWNDIVYQYFFTGDCLPYNDTNPSITNNLDGLILKVYTDNPEKIILEVGKDTTKEDLENSWEIIKQYRKSKPKRKRGQNNFLRNFKIFLLAKEGKTISEICNIIEKEFKIDNLDYGNIKKIVSYFYKRFKIPKKDRVKLKMN